MHETGALWVSGPRVNMWSASVEKWMRVRGEKERGMQCERRTGKGATILRHAWANYSGMRGTSRRTSSYAVKGRSFVPLWAVCVRTKQMWFYLISWSCLCTSWARWWYCTILTRSCVWKLLFCFLTAVLYRAVVNYTWWEPRSDSVPPPGQKGFFFPRSIPFPSPTTRETSGSNQSGGIKGEPSLCWEGDITQISHSQLCGFRTGSAPPPFRTKHSSSFFLYFCFYEQLTDILGVYQGVFKSRGGLGTRRR